MKMKLVFLISVVVIRVQAANICRFTAIDEAQVSYSEIEKTLSSWRKQNPKATTDDVICCLPEKWRANFVVVPDSKSLQCSGANFPRVILFDPAQSSEQPLRLALSFVGPKKGDTVCNAKFSGYNNHDSIEFLDFNQARGSDDMFRMVHLEPAKNPPMKVNPFVCVDCHRTPDGMRPFANDLGAQYSNLGGFAVGNAGKSTPDCATKAERDQQRWWDQDFKRLVYKDKQRPYSCLSQVPKNSGPAELRVYRARNDEFVRRLALAQNFHIAARIKNTTEYEKYKFAMMAVAVGCVSEKSPFTEYLPPEPLPISLASLAGIESDKAAMVCHSRKGICEKAIPSTCQSLIQQNGKLVKAARQQLPNDYGQLLAQTHFDQGRNATAKPNNTERFVQLQYLLSQQPGAEQDGLDVLMNEYPGPRAINFSHLAKQMMEQDKALTVDSTAAPSPSDCEALRKNAQKAYKYQIRSADSPNTDSVQ